MHSKSICVAANGKVSFFSRMSSSIRLCVCLCAYVYNLVFFIHSSLDGHLGCFHILAIVNNTAVLGCICLFQLVFLFFSGIYVIGIAGLYLFLVFWENSTLFHMVAAPMYIPINSVLQFPFFHILANICYLLSFCDSRFDKCEMISHCGFDLQFPDD